MAEQEEEDLPEEEALTDENRFEELTEEDEKELTLQEQLDRVANFPKTGKTTADILHAKKHTSMTIASSRIYRR